MKTQMRFQKYICLAVLLTGVLATIYAFCYSTLSLSELGYTVKSDGGSMWRASADKYDSTFYTDIQGFNDALMYCGIIMILLSVGLYITACSKRRNYYISNYIATGISAGANIIISLALLIMNGIWRSKFLNVDFDAWKSYWDGRVAASEITGVAIDVHYNDTTAMFDIGFAVYLIVIIAAVLLILNMVWKIKLMQGEKKLLAGNQLAGGEAV